MIDKTLLEDIFLLASFIPCRTNNSLVDISFEEKVPEYKGNWDLFGQYLKTHPANREQIGLSLEEISNIQIFRFIRNIFCHEESPDWINAKELMSYCLNFFGSRKDILDLISLYQEHCSFSLIFNKEKEDFIFQSFYCMTPEIQLSYPNDFVLHREDQNEKFYQILFGVDFALNFISSQLRRKNKRKDNVFEEKKKIKNENSLVISKEEEKKKLEFDCIFVLGNFFSGKSTISSYIIPWIILKEKNNQNINFIKIHFSWKKVKFDSNEEFSVLIASFFNFLLFQLKNDQNTETKQENNSNWRELSKEVEKMIKKTNQKIILILDDLFLFFSFLKSSKEVIILFDFFEILYALCYCLILPINYLEALILLFFSDSVESILSWSFLINCTIFDLEVFEKDQDSHKVKDIQRLFRCAYSKHQFMEKNLLRKISKFCGSSKISCIQLCYFYQSFFTSSTSSIDLIEKTIQDFYQKNILLVSQDQIEKLKSGNEFLKNDFMQVFYQLIDPKKGLKKEKFGKGPLRSKILFQKDQLWFLEFLKFNSFI